LKGEVFNFNTHKDISMKSSISKAIKLGNSPIAIMFANERPREAMMFQQGQRGCIIPMYTAVAKGKIAAFNRQTTGCNGAVTGLCFGNAWDKFPGGMEYFLSTGRGKGFPEGERYFKTPKLAKKWINSFPQINIQYEFVVMKPLEKVDEKKDKPVLISFYTDVNRICALTNLASYGRENSDNVLLRFSSGCQSLVLLPYVFSKEKPQKAVLGLFDITVRSMVESNYLSFTIPWKMFLEMESNVQGSFLDNKLWKKLVR
jgi:uncharacterized protein (DUF169 family)